MSDALKPCPFCGLTPEIENIEDGCFRIDHWCNDSMLDNFIVVEDETREQVEACWNRRADLALAPGETARVHEMERLLREGADLLQIEADALKEGISIGGDWQANLTPDDAHAVAAIREIEEWIGKVAALQPAPPGEGGEP